MKTSTQLKALIRNLSKKSNVKAEILLRNFMLEGSWNASPYPNTNATSS